MSFSLRTRVCFTALLFGLCLAPVSLAAAQHAPSANETALARQEFDAGMLAARDTRWEEARQHFTRSYELAPRPVTLLNLAGAQAQTGQLVAASESYRSFMSTASARDAERYRTQAEQALTALQARFGHAEVRIDGLAEQDEVRLDDAPLSRASLSLTLPLDPGEHVVTVQRRGAEVGRAAFDVTEGATSAVRVAVRAALPSAEDTAREANGASNDPRATGDSSLRVGSDPATRADEDSGGGVLSSPWFWLITGVVVAGAATAVIVVTTSGSTPDPFQGTLMPGSIVVE